MNKNRWEISVLLCAGALVLNAGNAAAQSCCAAAASYYNAGPVQVY